MTTTVKMPEPVGRRTRYRSEPGMIGHYPWTYTERMRKSPLDPRHEEELLFTAAQLQAYGDARAAELLEISDKDLDRIIDEQWGRGCHPNQYMAHRTFARAVLAAIRKGAEE